MKVKKLLLVALIIIALIIVIPTVALAGPGDDGVDVDIGITTGGDADVDVGIDAGGDVSLTINGEIPRFGAGAGSSMAAKRIAMDAVAPYLKELYERTGINGDALAKLIKIVGNDHTHELAEHESEIYNQGVDISFLRDKLDLTQAQAEYLLIAVPDLDVRLSEKIDNIDAKYDAQISSLVTGYNRLLTIIIAAGAFLIIALGTGLTLLWRRR
jgi:hypothetical protein